MIPLSILAWSGLAILVLWVVVAYNNFVRKDKLAEEAWHGIDVQLKRRFDLIPSLVETVKGYAKHESNTLEKIIQLRNSMLTTASITEQAKDEVQLSEMLKSVFAISESYPELKADTNFLELQKNLGEIEDTLQEARRYYNATVRDYNTLLSLFPANIVANIFNFKKRDFFAITNSEERKNVKVSF